MYCLLRSLDTPVGSRSSDGGAPEPWAEFYGLALDDLGWRGEARRAGLVACGPTDATNAKPTSSRALPRPHWCVRTASPEGASPDDVPQAPRSGERDRGAASIRWRGDSWAPRRRRSERHQGGRPAELRRCAAPDGLGDQPPRPRLRRRAGIAPHRCTGALARTRQPGSAYAWSVAGASRTHFGCGDCLPRPTREGRPHLPHQGRHRSPGRSHPLRGGCQGGGALVLHAARAGDRSGTRAVHRRRTRCGVALPRRFERRTGRAQGAEALTPGGANRLFVNRVHPRSGPARNPYRSTCFRHSSAVAVTGHGSMYLNH